jgi:hypothetical protein
VLQGAEGRIHGRQLTLKGVPPGTQQMQLAFLVAAAAVGRIAESGLAAEGEEHGEGGRCPGFTAFTARPAEPDEAAPQQTDVLP